MASIGPPASSSPEADDFYAFTITTQWYSLLEKEPNDDRSTSFILQDHGQEPGVIRYEIAGRLPPGDVDWWGVDWHGEGTSYELSCASWQLGSSLRDATFALYFSEEQEPLQVQVESAHTTVRWSDDPAKLPTMPAVVVPPGVGGSHYLRITATQYEPSIESVHYACAVTARQP